MLPSGDPAPEKYNHHLAMSYEILFWVNTRLSYQKSRPLSLGHIKVRTTWSNKTHSWCMPNTIWPSPHPPSPMLAWSLCACPSAHYAPSSRSWIEKRRLFTTCYFLMYFSLSLSFSFDGIEEEDQHSSCTGDFQFWSETPRSATTSLSQDAPLNWTRDDGAEAKQSPGFFHRAHPWCWALGRSARDSGGY